MYFMKGKQGFYIVGFGMQQRRHRRDSYSYTIATAIIDVRLLSQGHLRVPTGGVPRASSARLRWACNNERHTWRTRGGHLRHHGLLYISSKDASPPTDLASRSAGILFHSLPPVHQQGIYRHLRVRQRPHASNIIGHYVYDYNTATDTGHRATHHYTQETLFREQARDARQEYSTGFELLTAGFSITTGAFFGRAHLLRVVWAPYDYARVRAASVPSADGYLTDRSRTDRTESTPTPLDSSQARAWVKYTNMTAIADRHSEHGDGNRWEIIDQYDL